MIIQNVSYLDEGEKMDEVRINLGNTSPKFDAEQDLWLADILLVKTEYNGTKLFIGNQEVATE